MGIDADRVEAMRIDLSGVGQACAREDGREQADASEIEGDRYRKTKGRAGKPRVVD